MKICSPQLGLAPNSILGGEVYDREILKGLAKKGVKVEIILPADASYESNIKNWHITNIHFKHFPAILFNVLVIPYLFISYKRTNFDILRLHSPQFIGFGAVFFKLFFPSVKIVACYHQFRESEMYGLGKYFNNYWDFIITDSNFVKEKIVKKYKVMPSKIAAIHNGVPSYLKPQAQTRKQADKLTLLFMGLFIERKNPLILIKILKKMKDKKISLIFTGTGPLKEKIINEAKKSDLLHQITVFDPVFGKEKLELLSKADVFVHPSTDEGFPLAPLEAMAVAKPIIVARGWSAAEMITEGVNGFIVSSEKEWISAIKKLKNKEKRDQMGKHSYQKTKKEFQWDIAIKKHMEIFNKL